MKKLTLFRIFGGQLKESKFSGINVCVYMPTTGKMIGTPYPMNGLVSDNVELQYRYRIQGEHWGIVRTDLLKKYRFPQTKGHFYTESRLWFTMAKHGYKVMCFNDCLRAYYHVPTSLTNNKKYQLDYNTNRMFLQNTLWTLTNLGNQIFHYSIKGYIKLWKQSIKLMLKTILGLILQKINN